MKVWVNKECGNIHFSFKDAWKEGVEMYDIDDPTNAVEFEEFYELIQLEAAK